MSAGQHLFLVLLLFTGTSIKKHDSYLLDISLNNEAKILVGGLAAGEISESKSGPRSSFEISSDDDLMAKWSPNHLVSISERPA